VAPLTCVNHPVGGVHVLLVASKTAINKSPATLLAGILTVAVELLSPVTLLYERKFTIILSFSCQSKFNKILLLNVKIGDIHL
jgi:hypothetical protein